MKPSEIILLEQEKAFQPEEQSQEKLPSVLMQVCSDEQLCAPLERLYKKIVQCKTSIH